MRQVLPVDSPACIDDVLQGQQEALLSGRSRRRRGATAMEYLFVISLILTVAISGIGFFGQSTKDTAQKASNAIQNATSGK
jgi:Flp pilus assembly pilin Flp